MPYKIEFQGEVLSIQPRSNVWLYKLDNRTHSLTGFNLFLRGTAEGEEKDFSVAISGTQQAKHIFRIGDQIRGTAWTEKYPQWEYADYYRAGGLKKLSNGEFTRNPPPYTDETPELSVYDWRGCRMLDKRRWSGKCFTCKWACMANVTIEYNWASPKSFALKAIVMDRKTVSFTPWERQGLSLTRIVAHFMTMAGWMSCVPSGVEMMNEE